MKEELLYYVNHSAEVLFYSREKNDKLLQTGQADIAAEIILKNLKLFSKSTVYINDRI